MPVDGLLFSLLVLHALGAHTVCCLSLFLSPLSCRQLSGMEEEEEERKELISLLVLTAHRMEKEKEKRMSGESVDE